MERDSRAGYLTPKEVAISIHALRMERDEAFKTPPPAAQDFNPRAPHGARPTALTVRESVGGISIHALRMERDPRSLDPSDPTQHFNPRAPHGARPFPVIRKEGIAGFQSTRSAWSATPDFSEAEGLTSISIHALRMERDCTLCIYHCQSYISIHALRMERDMGVRHRLGAAAQFQSTRSAWSATVIFLLIGRN